MRQALKIKQNLEMQQGHKYRAISWDRTYIDGSMILVC